MRIPFANKAWDRACRPFGAVVAILLFTSVPFTSVQSFAQTPLEKVLEEIETTSSLLDEEPFDIVTLTAEASGRSVKVAPIDFPNRRIPTDTKDGEKLQVTILLFPTRRYEVAWNDVARIWLYEQMILERAKTMVREKNFGEAFEHLNYLMVNYPQTPGLASLRQEFLIESAADLLQRKSLPHAMAVLEELQKSFPNYQRDRVRNLITTVSNQLVQAYFDKNDLATAKAMVARLDKDYSADPLPVVGQWKEKFLELAEEYRARALQLRDRKDYLGARREAKRMLEIEPEIDGGKDLLRDLLREYPIARVAVFQQSNHPDTAALADWPAFRSGQLIEKPLFEFRGTGAEGGQYRFSLGSFQQSDDQFELDLAIQNAGNVGVPNSLMLSQSFLRRATIGKPDYSPAWAAILDSVSVFGPERLKLRFRRPHVLPQAFLQWPIERTSAESGPPGVLYRVQGDEGTVRRFAWSASTPAAEFQPLEIHEVLYQDPNEAINQFLRGDVEIIDRLFPADARRLRGASVARTVTVENYALPTVHMLVPRRSNPYLDDREFRRALLYAINREAILKGEILGGGEAAQSQVISGPFPRGAVDTDPIAYAYNTSVENLAYDPRLAKVLILIASNKLRVAAEKKGDKLPPIPKLSLGVPNYEAARVAGQAIIEQWKLIDVPGELVVLDRIPSPKEESPVDIVYLTASVWEPATDAERLFGVGAPAQTNNQFIVQALSQLGAARNWIQVRQGCQDLHSLVAAHLPILPLWQVGESFAYRSELIGIAPKPLGLYQDVQKWRYRVP
ncbi:MAG: ABC transporter substrate-binding protein [Planctomycetota bacterium]|jgi:tetratricopeptide (TPR) repeat protein